MQPAGAWRATAAAAAASLTLLVLMPPSYTSCDGFLVVPSAPSSTTAASTSRAVIRRTACRTATMSTTTSEDEGREVAPPTSLSSSFSRGSFLAQGARSVAAVAVGWAVVGSSERAGATEIGGIDIRGIDVSEVLHPGAGGGGGKATKPLRDCVLNVERVRVSTKQLEDELTNKGAPPGLNGMVKGLVKNYKLDESLRQGAMYIESSGDRRVADSAGREALEFLAQTAEYFPATLDERTGMVKTLNAEALEFTVNALGATREKLDLYLSKLPPDALREARAELKAEGSEVAK